jgi:hypothetical protein
VAWPSPVAEITQGAGTAMCTERGHRERPGPHGGALATDAAVVG